MNPAEFSGHLPGSGTAGKVGWSSPSNIALTKYWGKHGDQLPRNPSVSFTLSEARTITSIEFTACEKLASPDVAFSFDGESKPEFAERIVKFLMANETAMPYVRHFKWRIESKNTFPHSSGIASSASAMSCLVMCLMEIEQQYLGHEMEKDALLRRASFLSRLASGSASRSVFPLAALWGQCPGVEESSDFYAIPAADWLHSDFRGFHDDIIIVSADKKAVSSSAGHRLMESNPFSSTRFKQATDHTIQMKEVLSSGDMDSFIEIVENEALTLHALMMTSRPSYILMEPGTLEIIKEIRTFRKATDIPISFTLDAGPNVHVLYPPNHAEMCFDFIEEKLLPLSTGTLIRDRLGEGPQRV